MWRLDIFYMGLQRQYLNILMSFWDTWHRFLLVSKRHWWRIRINARKTQTHLLFAQDPSHQRNPSFLHANALGIASPRTGKQPGCIAWQLLSSPQQCYTPLRSRNGLLVLNLIHICSKRSESTLFLYFDHIFSNVQFHEPYAMVSNLNIFLRLNIN